MMKKEENSNPTQSVESKSVEKKKYKKRDSSDKKKMTAREREEMLIENFVGLQQAMTNLSVRFANLSDNITKLLQVFEEAAKNFMEGSKPDNRKREKNPP